MAQVKNSEELEARLRQASGEDILAFGWGTLGMKNVFIGLTPSALLLEFVSFTGASKDIKRIPFEELLFVYAAAGDASTPALMKMNLESRIADALTGTLMFKERTGRLAHVLFRKMPNHDSNNKAPFRITQKLSELKPALVYLPDLKSLREKQTKGGCLRRFAILSLSVSAVLTVVFFFATEEGIGFAASIGLATGVVLGAAFAPLIPVFKRMISGEG